jgi:hypothetical protein
MLINKPRAFRNVSLGDGLPVRKTMILLGSDTPNTRVIPKYHKKLIENRKWQEK